MYTIILKNKNGRKLYEVNNVDFLPQDPEQFDLALHCVCVGMGAACQIGQIQLVDEDSGRVVADKVFIRNLLNQYKAK